MVDFFLNRPVLVWVLAFVVMIAGLLGLKSIPIEQYPLVAPPIIQIVATYPGASADTVAATVTQVIEQSLSGIDHLLYISSTSTNAGQANITLTLQPGANPDVAEMQVQNRVSQVSATLPLSVEQQGIAVSKSTRSFLMAVSLSSKTGNVSSIDLGNMLASQFQDSIGQINGVGNLTLFSPQHAMRVWLDPNKLRQFGLTATDVTAAIASQNVETSVGEIGGIPATPSQAINATITSSSLMHDVAQFQNILLRVNTTGSRVTLGDVARIEVGGDNYQTISRINGKPGAALTIELASGANALAVAAAVRARVNMLKDQLPTDILVDYPFDSTPFIKESIKDVALTLIESIGLVFLVMFFFLHRLRITIIPAIVIPIVLLGTCAILNTVGMSLNVLSMFAIILAIGLLVDDAIVVVENADRIMQEENLTAKEATRKAVTQITGALVGMTTVLMAIFVPMAFFPGSTGAIYRQFTVTIVVAMMLSLLLALTLTPSLCCTLLSRGDHDGKGIVEVKAAQLIDYGMRVHQVLLERFLQRKTWGMVFFGVIVVAFSVLMYRLPTSYLPDEDQGLVVVIISAPVGTPLAITDRTVKQVEEYLMQQEPSTNKLLTLDAFTFGGQGQNNATIFVSLKDWAVRKDDSKSAIAIINRINNHFSSMRDTQVLAVNLPAIPSLGDENGLDFEIEDIAGHGHAQLLLARDFLLSLAAKNPVLVEAHAAGLDDAPQLHLDVNREKAESLGLAIADINNTLEIGFGSAYVNNYIDSGRIQKVFVQADAPFRMMPDDIGKWYVRAVTAPNSPNSRNLDAESIDSQMVPLSAFSTTRWTLGPPQIERYNHVLAMEMGAQAAPGFSTGQAMSALRTLEAKLPTGFAIEWTGQSLQEATSDEQSQNLYAVSIIVVFLCLAGLYESWTLPLAVLLVVPLGALGAVLAATVFKMPDDIYFKVGLLTTIGLATKNSILITEFANEMRKKGHSLVDSAVWGARARLKPIAMTSIAFGFGVLPLVFSTGAGAESRRALGTAVTGGILGGTILAVFYVPIFFILVNSISQKNR